MEPCAKTFHKLFSGSGSVGSITKRHLTDLGPPCCFGTSFGGGVSPLCLTAASMESSSSSSSSLALLFKDESTGNGSISRQAGNEASRLVSKTSPRNSQN